MLRGLYTGATGMMMNQRRMDVIANNLANVDKTGFKTDDALFKAFPEMLIQRVRDDGLGIVPLGSFDLAPIVGKLGLGAEFSETYTRFEQGPAKRTENPLDLMIDDRSRERPSFFVVQTAAGERLTRSGSFTINREGLIVTHDGFPLLGENGPIQVARYNFMIRENGEIWINGAIGNEPDAGASPASNQYEQPVLLDRIRMRTVEFPRELKKEANSFYMVTPESGPLRPIEDFPDIESPQLLQGFLEGSNVNIVREMTALIEVQREYEANQKSVTTHDSLLGKLINEVAR